MRIDSMIRNAVAATLLAWLAVSSAPAGSPMLTEDFEGDVPPPGWSTVDDSVSPLDCAWKRSDDYTLSGLNAPTLGAAADSDHCAPEETPEGDVDTFLISPELDLSGSTETVLSYDVAYRHFFPTSEATLDVSTDGGASWTTEATYNSSPPISEFTPEQEIIDLSAYDGEPGVTLRWRYTAGHGWWVFIDNVIVGPAGPGVLEADPSMLAFGDVHTGVVSTAEVSVANTANPGDDSIELASAELTGDGAFSVLGGDCEAGVTVLDPGDSCMVRLAFSPAAVAGFVGQLEIGTTGGQSQAVSVSGTGIPTSQVEVDPEALAVTLDIGDTSDRTLEIANPGTADLEWEIPLIHGQEGSGTGFGDVLREGALLVHNAGSQSIAAMDPETGDLIAPDLISTEPLGFGAKRHVLLHPDGERVLVSDQIGNVVHAFDTEGEYLGVFAPVGGADTSIMQNIRGMAFHPDSGHLLVTSAGGDNAHSVVEFDLQGNYLGQFIASAAGGLDGPWSLEFRDADLLVSTGLSGGIHVFEHDGTPVGPFTTTSMNFVQQIKEAAAGNVLATDSAGVFEFAADGSHLDTYTPFTSLSGVHELPNGDLLVAASGVHQIDREGNIVRDILSGSSSMISSVKAVDCTVPDWLNIAPTSGVVSPGGVPAEVTVNFDAAGLGQGVHETVLCVESNDPLQPRVQVPVTLTVEKPVDHGVIEGEVQSAGHCDQEVSLLEGAMVEAVGSGGETASAVTDENGVYSLSISESASPVEVTASAPDHLDAVSSDVPVQAGQGVTRDFELVLDAPCAVIADNHYAFDLQLGEEATDSLLIGNFNGGGSLEWSIDEGPGLTVNPNPRAHFPPQRRTVEHVQDPSVSTGPARQRTDSENGYAPTGVADFAVPAFSTTGNQGGPGYVSMDALAPSSLTTVNADQPTTFYAGTFIRNDFKNHYMLASAGGAAPLHAFGRVDTFTGEFAMEGNVTGAPAVTIWTSMKWDHATGTLYATGNEDELYTVDPDTLEATLVGRISGPGLNPDGAVVVSIAISPDGLMYALDLVDDVLLAVDKTTAEAAVIGPVGVDANFAQDMDFDQTTGELYWAAYLNNDDSRIYRLDLDTGEPALIGNIQGRSELQAFTIAQPGGGCSTPEDIGWLSVSTSSGTTAPQASDEVSFSVNTDGLQHGSHEAFLCVATNDPVSDRVRIPVSLEVTDPAAGFLEGTVAGAGRCGQDPRPLAEATVSVTGSGNTFEVTTDEAGGYSIPINENEGPVDINVTAGNHLDASVSDVVIEAGATTAEDFELPLEAPCLTVGPDSIEAEVGLDGGATRTLTVGNADGHAALEWTLDTAAGPLDLPSTALQRMAGTPVGGGALSHGSGSLEQTVETPLPSGEMQMSQTSDTNIVPSNSVGCPIGPNHLLRRFYYEEHPGVGNRINSVDIGIQDTMGSAVITVNLYRLPSSTPVDTIPVESLELIGAYAQPVSAGDNGTLVNVPVTGTIDDPEAYDLVVEVVASGSFFIGATDTGETHPGFIVAPQCGNDEPSRIDQMEGFETVHIIQVVNVASGGSCAPPEEISWLAFAPASGTTAAGESSEVTLSLDATDLAAGGHEAVVCVDSNDPGDPRAEVPVNLTVLDQPAAELAVEPDALDFGEVSSGTMAVRTFEVSNVAGAGAVDLSLESIAASGDAAFGVSGGSCSTGGQIAPGESCTVEVGFAPESEGPHAGQIMIEASEQAAAVTLSGLGGEPPPEIFSDRFEVTDGGR